MERRAWSPRQLATQLYQFFVSHPRWLAGLCVGLMAVVWLVLAFGPFHLGATEIDSATYVNSALHPKGTTKHQNRYVHVWGLRVAFGLIGDGKLASAAYSCAVTLGTLAAAAVVSWVMGGLAGVLAVGVLTLSAPSRLFWPNSLMVDPTMALYATAALASAVLAQRDPQASKRSLAWAAASGLACFLALKSKETGVGVVPAVLLLLWHAGPRRHLPVWLAGAALGWCALAVVDGLLLDDAIRSVRPDSYQLPNLRSMTALKSPGTLTQNYFQLLTQEPHLGLTMLGLCGFAMGRRSVLMKACLLWFTCTLLFLAWISWVYVGIQPLMRQIVGLELPLALAGGYAIARQFRPLAAKPEAWWSTCLFVFLCIGPLVLCWFGPAWFGLSRGSERRLLFHVLPIAMIVLPLGLLGCDGRRSGKVLALLAPLAIGYSSLGPALDHHRTLVTLSAPLDAALRRIDPDGVARLRVAVFGLGKYGAEQTRRQLQMRGGRHVRELRVTQLRSPADAPEFDLVLAEYSKASQLSGAGFTRLDSARFKASRRQLVLLGKNTKPRN